MTPESESAGNVGVMIEMRVPRGTPGAFAVQMSTALPGGFQPDPDFAPVPMTPPAGHGMGLTPGGEETILVRGTVDPARIPDIEAQPNVVQVWRDTPIAPFAPGRASRRRTTATPQPAVLDGGSSLLQATPATGACGIPPCDCTFGNPAIGTLAEVATYLGVDKIWTQGFKGSGIRVGVVDGGITAIGRPVKQGEVARVLHVVGGWPGDWGTTAAGWDNHGNMTSTDVLGIAPDAEIYDLRISTAQTLSGVISNAIQAFQWAINQHRTNGTPQVLTNSWGIFQENWDPVYARNASHPFTRKVVEALDEGIIVLFSAGNCGAACPDGRCGADNGPGRDIWGANGHPRVMTVGAVNLKGQYVGYSSAGPAALDPSKPDFCSITHFAGYFPNVDPAYTSDGGTSAATPIAAGVVALLKQKGPNLTQDQLKDALKTTAKDIGPAGWDQYAGAGIINAQAAWDKLFGIKLKILDDHQTHPILDNVTLKFGDDQVSIKILDDQVTLKFSDDHKTYKGLDDQATLKFSDDQGTLKGLDDHLTLKTTDDVGALGAPGREPGALSEGAVPFALATPHHSMAWARLTTDQTQAQSYEAAIDQYEQTLDALEKTMLQLNSQLLTLDQEYRQILGQYDVLCEEYKRASAAS